jgi:hypothetical protein
MSHRRGGLKIGKLYIPHSTLKGIGGVVKDAAKDGEKIIMAPTELTEGFAHAIGGTGGSTMIIVAVCVAGFIGYQFIMKK